MNGYKEEYVKNAAAKIASYGFKVMLAEGGTHGYYTDEKALRVVSFQYDLCGEISFSGNYISESNGTGWGMCTALPEALTQNGLQGMLYANSQFTCKSYTTEAQYLQRYNSSSKYTEVKVNPFDVYRRHTVKIEYDNGQQTITEINGTPDDIVKYYIGTSFVLHECENTGKETKAVGAKIWFNDGCSAWLQHHHIYKLINKGSWGYVVDHGDKIGLELHSREHNGSKYFTDERRKQYLGLQNHAGNWLALIKKEF